MAGIDKDLLALARRQFCMDIGMDWQYYEKEPHKKVYIQKMTYLSGTGFSAIKGARCYVNSDSFFVAVMCMGQLFLGVDEEIYDWACERFADCQPEWFCKYEHLRRIDEKLHQYGKGIGDTHVYYLPDADMAAKTDPEGNTAQGMPLLWYEQDELLRFRENNRFTSAICFSPTQPDMLAVAALGANAEKQTAAQEDFAGMAGVSADGEYLWQIGINVDEKYRGQGLAAYLVRTLAKEVLARGKVPFYGTSESHTISQTVAYKAGFVPAFTEVYVRDLSKTEEK